MPQEILIIEKLNLHRLKELIKILDEYLLPTYGDGYNRWKQKLSDDFKEGKKIALVAMIDNVVVGAAIYQSYPMVFQNVKTIELKTFLVVNKFRNHRLKVGSQLIDRVQYEAQRTGYNRIIVDAKHDNLIVPWLLGKGYKITNFTREFDFLSYKVEKKFSEIFTDDIDDPQLVLKYIMKQLQIFEPVALKGGWRPAYEGQLTIPSPCRNIKIGTRIRFCPETNEIKKFLKIDRKDKLIFFYVINYEVTKLPPEIVEQIRKINGNIIDSDDLKSILSAKFPIMKRTIPGDYCLSVLVYPGMIDRIKEKFDINKFKFVISGIMGNLLTKNSRIIFVSNVDYSVQGAAYYLSHHACEGRENTWEYCSNDTVFEKDEFMRWANIKKKFTVFELETIKSIPQPTPLKIDEQELILNKWVYYPYKMFMDNMEPQLK